MAGRLSTIDRASVICFLFAEAAMAEAKFSVGCRQGSGICATLVLFSRQRGLTHAYAQSYVSGFFSFGYVNGCLLQSCHDTGCHIATKCVSNDGLCEVKRCQSGVDRLQACKHVCKQVSK